MTDQRPSIPNLPPEGVAAMKAKLPTYLANHCTLFNSDNLIQMVFGSKQPGDELPNFQCSAMVRKCARLNAPSLPVKACWATSANG